MTEYRKLIFVSCDSCGFRYSYFREGPFDIADDDNGVCECGSGYTVKVYQFQREEQGGIE